MSNLPTTNAPSFAQQLKKLLSLLGRAITHPVVEEWPTLVLLMLIFGSTINIWINPIAGNRMPVDLFFLHWCRNFTAAYFFVAVLCLFPRKLPRNCVRTLLITITSLLLLLETISYSIFDLHISIPLITLLSETNTHEISTTWSVLLKSYGFYTTLIRFAILISLFGIAQKYRETINCKIHSFLHSNRRAALKSPRIVYATASTLLAAVIISGAVNLCNTFKFLRFSKTTELESIFNWYLSNDVDLLSRTALVLKHLPLQHNEFKQWEQSQLNFIENGITTSNASDSLKVVGIIGESFILSHASVYGYPLETTPRISAECQKGNMVTYTDIACYDCHTTQSIQSIMALTPHGDMSKWTQSIFFPLAFKKNGFKVNYYDNQCVSSHSYFSITLAAQVLNKIIVENCYDDYYDKNQKKYDLEFITDVTPTEANPEHKELTIYHLFGSHLWAEYPRTPQWERFKPADIPNQEKRPWLNDEKLQLIADYDNSIYYNDSVIAHIINRYRNCEAVIVYFSDHGEEIFDYRAEAYRSRVPEKNHETEWKEAMFHVPFFIWMSDLYIQRNPLQAKAIREAADRPGMLSRIAHTFLRLAEIETPVYDPTADILSPHYIPRPRIIINGYHYDRPNEQPSHN